VTYLLVSSCVFKGSTAFSQQKIDCLFYHFPFFYRNTHSTFSFFYQKICCFVDCNYKGSTFHSNFKNTTSRINNNKGSIQIKNFIFAPADFNNFAAQPVFLNHQKIDFLLFSRFISETCDDREMIFGYLRPSLIKI
jgi:hypothetical protein